MEALVRWRHPERGLIIPEEEFTETAGHADLMRDLTRHVVDSALDQAQAWWQSGLAVQVSLKVSARDLLDAGLTATISRGLDSRGLPPEALMLQINERVLTAEPGHAAAAVDALAALGLSVSLDDFGTGYSSLVRLKRLPLCEIKIDSSFVGRLPAADDDEVIVAPWWIWSARWACARWPRESSPRPRRPRCAGWAARWPRACTSAARSPRPGDRLAAQARRRRRSPGPVPRRPHRPPSAHRRPGREPGLTHPLSVRPGAAGDLGLPHAHHP